MEVLGQVDKKNTFLLLGCYCNSPKSVIDKKYETTQVDYCEPFHKVVWGAINNIARRNVIDKITPVEIETELTASEEALGLWKINDGRNYIYKALEATEDKVGNIASYYDTVRKYSILREANVHLGLNTIFIYDETNPQLMEEFYKMNHKEVLVRINEKFLDFKKNWSANGGADAYGFHAGDEVDSLLEKFRGKKEAFGYPFQSKYLTTIFRGMRPKKYMLRSCPSGVGKSRLAMAEACNIACDYIFDWNKKEWVYTGERQDALFISTELEREEIQACILAHISGVDEDKITEWDLTEMQERVVLDAKQMMKDSSLHCEFIGDYTIADIEEIIERYIINKDVRYVFFDYINETPSLMSDYVNKSGVSLKTHQVLFLFSNSLKLLANKYNIYLSSSTQLSSNWKEDNQRDANALKGSKAIAEKADYGVLGLPVTAGDLKKLKPILQTMFVDEPNMAYWIYKNRGGKWKSIIVWTRLNLGTVREEDCFVTDLSYCLETRVDMTTIDLMPSMSVGEITSLSSDVEDSVLNAVGEFVDVNIDDLRGMGM